MGFGDISGLGGFVAPAKEEQQYLPALNKVNSIACAKVDSHFPDSSANDLHITEIPELGGVKSSGDSSASLPVFKETLIYPLDLMQHWYEEERKDEAADAGWI